LGSGSGKVCYIAAQVVGLFGSRAALNYMIVSDAGKPFEMDDRPTESGALVLKASLGRSHPFARRSDHHLPKAPIERVKIGRRSWVSFGRRLTHRTQRRRSDWDRRDPDVLCRVICRSRSAVMCGATGFLARTTARQVIGGFCTASPPRLIQKPWLRVR
jgi:hypothetical protein